MSLLLMLGSDDFPPFAFNPARQGANYTLSAVGGTANNRATKTGSGQTSVLGLQALAIPLTMVFTVGLISGTNSPDLGAGNASASVSTYLGAANSFAAFLDTTTNNVFANNSVVGSTGFVAVTGDVIRMQENGGQVRFSKNGGAYTLWITHGISGPLFPGITLNNSTEYVTGAWEF